MKRKRVYQVGYWVLFIIMVLVGSCQAELDMDKYNDLVEDVEDNEGETIEELTEIIDELEEAIDELEEIIDEFTEDEDIIIMEYRNNVDYHFPASMADKQIRVIESGQVYGFAALGIYLPTEMMLYPNPVTPEMFINAVEGQTTESVEITMLDDVETGFTYSIYMSGKFEYKGNLYYGEVKIIVVYLNGILTLNGLNAEFVE